MGETLAQKIIRAHLLHGDMTPGSEIALRIDQTLTQDATGTMAYLEFETMGIPRVKTELSVAYVDHNTLQSGFENADDHRYLQTVAKKHGVWFSRPGNGICLQVQLERFGKPGKTLIGSDSHTPTGGGIGMLAFGAGGMDVAVAMGGGAYYITMPKMFKVNLTGTLRPYVTAKDISLELLRILSVKGGIGGGGMETLSFERVARKAHEMGLVTGVALHCFSRWEWTTATFDIPTIGSISVAADVISVRYGDGAAPELKRRMTTGGYDFIKRSSVNYPAVQRNNAGVTTYTPAACIVELNVNTFTGEIEIMRHHSLVDSGQMIVPELVSGQLQGGLAMGIGHALMEELPLYEDGPGNGTWNFNRYTLPRAKNVAVWNQTADYLAPLSETSPTRGLGEVVMVPIIAATGNAIAHAIGKRFYQLPVTPEKIRKALAL